MPKDVEKTMKRITPRSQDVTQWYTDMVLNAELADYAPVRGCMVIRPYGYAIWENIQRILDARIKALGHVNAYFPLFIPESFLKKEAEHVEGFAPECAWVTMGGREELEERLAVRPTSETIVYAMYAKWVQSYRDLPILINQWANVVRWEKTTRPFLRTTEFLWQEGHTAHATEIEAEAEARQILDLYRTFVEDELAIPLFVGEKSARERFAGAQRTYTIEAMMTDGKALQAGTSHNLGTAFSKAFEIRFLDADGELKHPWQTSWGVSTRLIGASVLTHGDDKGLILPPAVAPYHVVIVPIYFKDADKATVLDAVRKVRGLLDSMAYGGAPLRLLADTREQYTPGWKFNEWEMRGAPVRLELGPKDAAKSQVVLVRRDTGEKKPVAWADLVKAVSDTLLAIRDSLFDSAKRFKEERTVAATDFAGLVEGVKTGFVRAVWCGSGECEEKLKAETGATLRCLPFDEPVPAGAKCAICGGAVRPSGREGGGIAYFARSY
ncbi:MAG: proline--tRNA ligase [bacterium]